jgi:hypothetical protein
MMTTMMTSGRVRVGIAALVLTAAWEMGQGGVAHAAPELGASKPVHAFVQAGSGLTEFAHAEAGVFLVPRLTLEAMVAWQGVYGMRYGGGLMYAFGPAEDGRPPRHALLVGARLMLNSTASFDSHGDDLSSYAVVPVGYGYRHDSGFYLRATIAPILLRERKDQPDGSGGVTVAHDWTVGGPMINVAAGLTF